MSLTGLQQNTGCFPFNKKFWFEILEISHAQWNDTSCVHRPDPSLRAFGYCSLLIGFKRALLGTTILSNGEGHFRPTGRNDQTGQSGPPSKLVPNIHVGPNQNGPFHLMYQLKFPEFWVEWKVPTLSIFILAPELVFDHLFTCSWPMQLWAVLQFSKENSLSAQGGL